MSTTDKGQRRFRITPEVFEGWLIHGNSISTNLPDDARFLRLIPLEDRPVYFMVFESREWAPLDEGEMIPEIEVIVEEDNDE